MLVRRLLDAYNTADETTLRALLGTDLHQFSVDRRAVGGTFFAATKTDAVFLYIKDRHREGEHLGLARLAVATDNFDFDFDLDVLTQYAHYAAVGKGATNDPVDCHDQRIRVWNMVVNPS